MREEQESAQVSGLAAARKELPSLFPYLKRYKKGLSIGIFCVLMTAATANVIPLLVSKTLKHIEEESRTLSLKGPILLLESLIAQSVHQTHLIPAIWKFQSRGLDRVAMSYLRGPNRLMQLFWMLLAFALVSALFRFYQRWVLIGISRKIEYDLRNDLFDHLLAMPPAWFDRMTTGDIIARATNDLNQVRSMLGPGLMYPFNTLFMMTGSLIGMMLLSPSLTLIALFPPLIMAIGTNRLARMVHDRFTLVQEQYSRISTRVQENLAGIRVVKAYVREAGEVEAIRELNQGYLEKNLHYFRAEGVLYPFFSFSHNLGRFVVLSVGSVLMMVSSETFHVGDFAAFLLYMSMLLFPMISIGWVLNVIQRGVASLIRINEVFNEQPSIRDPENPVEELPRRGEIEFRGVSFGYRPGRKVLDSIDLTIPPGATLGVIGATGSGKSTLSHLIPRFYDPDEGEILLDGIPLRQYRLKNLRRMIGLVSQDHFMFSSTVRKNIGFGLPPEEFVADGVIEEASRLAALHENIVEFPKGYETLVGERGITLSGGQRQRAAIARAIAIDPLVLILDDALSAVDTHTEEQILHGLRHVMRGRTTLLISHRISSVQNADWIVVLEQGRIVEQGSHDDLIRLDGIYASIHRHQLIEAELEGLAG